MDEEYDKVRRIVEDKLDDILDKWYGPAHMIDILQECIKLLKPYAKKQEEITHA